MVNLASLYLLRKRKQFCFMFHYFILNLFLTCSSFWSSFSHTVFIKFFLIQKSKSSTNLNHKEGKQEEATIDKSTSISDSWGKNMSCVIFPWYNLPGGWEVFLGAIMQATNYPKGNFPWGQFPWGYCQGAIIFGVIVRKQQSEGSHLEGNFPRANFPREQLSLGEIVRRAIIRWAINPGGNFSRGHWLRYCKKNWKPINITMLTYPF